MLTLLVGLITLIPLESGAYLEEVLGKRGEAGEEVVLKVGAMPIPPPSRRQVIDANKGNDWDLWVMDADGTNKRRLTDDPALDGNGEWSPDGRKIAFDSDRMGNFDIWVLDVPQ